MGRPKENGKSQFCYRLGELTDTLSLFVNRVCFVVSDYFLQFPRLSS